LGLLILIAVVVGLGSDWMFFVLIDMVCIVLYFIMSIIWSVLKYLLFLGFSPYIAQHAIFELNLLGFLLADGLLSAISFVS